MQRMLWKLYDLRKKYINNNLARLNCYLQGGFMKKIIIITFIMLITACFSACTLGYTPPAEPETEPDTAAEEVTEKEDLIPLLFENESDGLFLYGIRPDGVVLYADGEGHFYDWAYACSDYRTPQIFTGNFDSNNIPDIAVVTYTKNDGVSVEDLRIISDGDFSAENVYMVNEDEFNSYAAAIVDYSFANNAVTFTADSVSYSFDLSDCFDKLVFDGISYSENVTYELADGKIYVNIIPTAKSGDEHNDYGKVNLDITLRAKLNFDGYNISLSDPTLKPHI